VCRDRQPNNHSCAGVALLAVMLALVVLSAVAVTLAVSVQTEARVDNADFDGLQAEELTRSGQEIAVFLQARGLTTNRDLLAGLPFEAVVLGFHYRFPATTGTVDIYFEADNGKINPGTAPPELVNNFFALWTGDLVKAQTITESIADWSDADNDAHPNGAEAPYYSSLNIGPRNAAMGISDLHFIRGMTPNDFHPKLIHTEEKNEVRPSIDSYLTDAPTGNVINVNFAPEFILRAIPGLSASDVATLVSFRRDRPFEDMNAVQSRSGISRESPAWRYLSVARNAPAVFTVARLSKTGLERSERRIVYSFNQLNFTSGFVELKSALGRIERNVFPDFL
jgi:hypothetical protein